MHSAQRRLDDAYRIVQGQGNDGLIDLATWANTDLASEVQPRVGQ
jgi:hypothetical protein